MRIATWNVNSVRQRLEHVLAYLRETKPDILCLQELKCTDEAFPRAEFEALSYNAAVHGQKGFNGVAILSNRPVEVTRGLPGDGSDVQSRYIEATVPDDNGIVRVVCLYLPNGNPVGSQKYPYKLAWMERLAVHAEKLLALEESLVLAGDFNVIPAAADASDPAAWVSDALYLPQTRARFQALLNLGLTDALRASSDAPGLYSFWDYQAGSWQRDNGIRIDHLLLSAQAADRLVAVAIDRDQRAKDKPSDHVPVRIDLR